MKKIAIITLNYNGKKDTLEFLQSLNSLVISSFEVKTVVVDNASKDGSVLEIKKQFPKVDVLQTGQNLGFAGGFNKGIDYAKVWGADYFLIINNDTQIKDKNLLNELVKTIEKDPKIGLVSPKIYFAKGYEFHKEKYKPEDLGQVIWYAGGSFDWDNIGSIHNGLDQVDNGQYNNVSQSEIVSGACVLIKKEVLEKVNGFDEQYFLYFEDSELSKKVSDLGFKKYYCGTVAIYHKVSQSTGIGSEITDYYHSRNRLIFGMKYGKGRTKFALIREAIWLLLFGRNQQRKGILGYFLGKKGGTYLEAASLDQNKTIEYPLKLSIGVVNYKTAKITKKLLESIFEKGSGFDKESMEVIVLDNGSEDNLKKDLNEYLPRIKYLENRENTGFSGGYNKTIKYSLGEYYLMLNSDIEVLKNGISELLFAEERFKGQAVLSGKLFFPDMGKQDSVFHLPTLTGAFKEYFLARWGSYFMYQPETEKEVQVEGAVMACFLIPRQIINKVGLLDEGTFIYFEDIEYCRRLKKLGIPFYYIPQAQFIHHHGASSKVIGIDKSQALLQKAAKHYHGEFYNFLLSIVLRLGQKFGRVETPVPHWAKKEQLKDKL